jgi:hypothetical protein
LLSGFRSGPSGKTENLGTRAGHAPGFFLAIDNNREKENPMKKLADSLHTIALEATIEVLRGTLGEAIDYLTQDEHLAALGTLILFDDHAEDVKAAIRLFRRDVQSHGRHK